jgi:uncharacterized protein DUF4192
MCNSSARGSRPQLKIRSPQDAVSAVPYMLGFHPASSLVAVGYDGPSSTCAVRIDLPDEDDISGESAARVAQLLSGNKFRQALLVGYGPLDRVMPAVLDVRAALAQQGIAVHEALRVEDGRWWSLTCRDAECCPPEGLVFDVSTSVVAAQATLAGAVAYADRAELAETVAPLTGEPREAMRQATERAKERILSYSATLDPRDIRAILVEEGIPFLTKLMSRCQEESASPPDDDEVAWLAILLTNLRVRDEAWVRIDPDNPIPHINFWRDVLRRVEEPLAAAPACLLAYSAYAAGDGGLANVALDRAEKANPDYTLTTLLREIIHNGIPPSAARLNMTPAQLAAAYAAQEETL